MITPQQIDQVAFKKSSFGGYNMQQVDEFLEPLTEDYVTLYKENALLKSKMRVLASKLEEYRKSGVEAKTASGDAKAAADKMLLETKAKCDRMLKEATAKAQAITASAVPAAPAAAGSNAEALIAAENARVEEARLAANAKIAEIQEQMRACIQALERIKAAAPAAKPVAPVAPAAPAAPAEPAAAVADAMHYDSGSVADEIAHNVEALVGSTEDTAPKAEPKHPTTDTTTSRFANLNLQFGRNYDPTHK